MITHFDLLGIPFICSYAGDTRTTPARAVAPNHIMRTSPESQFSLSARASAFDGAKLTGRVAPKFQVPVSLVKIATARGKACIDHRFGPRLRRPGQCTADGAAAACGPTESSACCQFETGGACKPGTVFYTLFL